MDFKLLQLDKKSIANLQKKQVSWARIYTQTLNHQNVILDESIALSGESLAIMIID